MNESLFHTKIYDTNQRHPQKNVFVDVTRHDPQCSVGWNISAHSLEKEWFE
jgi:hypothetical protein